MKKFIAFIRNFLHALNSPSYKRTINLLLLLVIALTIPLTLSLVKQRTNMQQLAQTGCGCTPGEYFRRCVPGATCPTDPSAGVREYKQCDSSGCWPASWNSECSSGCSPGGGTLTPSPTSVGGTCTPGTYERRCVTGATCPTDPSAGVREYRQCDSSGHWPTNWNSECFSGCSPGGGTCGQCWYTDGTNPLGCSGGTTYFYGTGGTGLNPTPVPPSTIGCNYCSQRSCTAPSSGTVSVSLGDYPRPGSDTGLGLHWSADVGWGYDDASANRAVCLLKSMGITWIKMNVSGTNGVGFARIMKANGIEPIVRLWRDRPNPGTLPGGDLAAVDSYRDAGIRYFESTNEPNLAGEWNGGIPSCQSAAEQTMQSWVQDAVHIQQKNVWPLFPALSPGGECAGDQSDLYFLRAAFNWLKNNTCTLANGTTGSCIMVFDTASSNGHPAAMAIHNYSYNHDNPSFYTGGDGNGFLKFQAYNTVINEEIGLSGHVAILSTEGGASIASNDDPNPMYPHPLGAAGLADLYTRIANYQQSHTTAYYYTTAFWLSTPNADGTWSSFAWWNRDYTPRIPETITALQNWATSHGLSSGTCVVNTPGPTQPGGLTPYPTSPNTGTSCTLNATYLPPAVTAVSPSTCADCIVTQKGLASFFASFNCNNTQMATYWCMGGISAAATAECNTLKTTTCAVNCGNGPTSAPATPTLAPYVQGSTRGIFGFAWTGIAPVSIPVGQNVFNNILNFIITLLVVVGTVAALLFLIYAGIKFITAGGDREKIESAKKTLVYAIIGLLVIVISFALIRLIGSVLGVRFLTNF